MSRSFLRCHFEDRVFGGRRICGLVGNIGAANWLHRSLGAKRRRLRMTTGKRGADKWDAREFTAEVGGVALAVVGVEQDGVDVVEDSHLVMEGSV